MNQPQRHRQDGRPELVRARIRQDLTQEQAAELIGVATTTWSRWERGEQRMRPVYRARLAQAWQVAAAEVERWLEATPPAHDVPDEERIDDVDLAVFDRTDATDRLWRWEMDASRRHLLATLPFVSGLLGEWLLAWRYDATPGVALGRMATPDGARVGWSDVQRVHEAHRAFVQMDHQFGAGLVRPAVTDFMNTTLAPLLRSRYSDDVGRALMSAAARLSRTAGWMAFDLGAHGQAQQHLGQALKLAKQADDDLTCAWILAALAQQACDLEHGRWAIRLAGAAAEAGQRGHASPKVMSSLHLRQARAFAVAAGTEQPDPYTRRQVSNLIAEAEDTYTPTTGDNDPAWIAAFGPAELTAEAGYCWQRIGEHQCGVEHAEQALASFASGFIRSIQFNRVHAAQARLDLGDLDGALAHARPAVGAAKELTSARAVAQVRDFATRLTQRHPHNAEAREFTDYLRRELGT
ncbi:helix-turn-helix transcriptional regulator [Nonomuraea rubra]|uniref:Transcriptional regulator with XRE-family HTH domain n=1 Tax=Nonomuraea rubra TaxID=46180 RepID=A0A7X0NP98_9ACTN|nr:helix-turn-helix transcriptional regulator [Nonomuraea rubra]MBB6546921.1 transcriptional regulator with XRE-family HTH domain [Nonomuraea rubra]